MGSIQNCHHFADDIFKSISLYRIVVLWFKFHWHFPSGSINNSSAMVQLMAWRRQGDKITSEPMVAQFTDALMRHSAICTWSSVRWNTWASSKNSPLIKCTANGAGLPTSHVRHHIFPMKPFWRSVSIRYYRLTHDLITHWDRVMHICVSKIIIIGSGNGLRLVGAKPLSEPMLEYCQLDPWE